MGNSYVFHAPVVASEMHWNKIYFDKLILSIDNAYIFVTHCKLTQHL